MTGILKTSQLPPKKHCQWVYFSSCCISKVMQSVLYTLASLLCGQREEAVFTLSVWKFQACWACDHTQRQHQRRVWCQIVLTHCMLLAVSICIFNLAFYCCFMIHFKDCLPKSRLHLKKGRKKVRTIGWTVKACKGISIFYDIKDEWGGWKTWS